MKKTQGKTDMIVAASQAITPAEAETVELLGEIRSLIESARGRAAEAVNIEMVKLY